MTPIEESSQLHALQMELGLCILITAYSFEPHPQILLQLWPRLLWSQHWWWDWLFHS